MYHPRSIYSSRPPQPYHFQDDLIWNDGTFKRETNCVAAIILREKTYYVVANINKQRKIFYVAGMILRFVQQLNINENMLHNLIHVATRWLHGHATLEL